MSTTHDPSLRGLDDCGCCTGTGARTPVKVENRPGLAAIAYRVGTHADFRASMLAALSSADRPALTRLTARDDDFTSALIDAWATVGDVLTFYQERIANEAFLRTATERRSVLEMARSIGYELAPGVASGTWLAFTLEDAPGAPQQVTIARGTRVQSVPGPGEKPQTFESSADVEGRPTWNELLPRTRRAQVIRKGMKEVWLAGAAPAVATGDALLFVGAARRAVKTSEQWDFRIVTAVTPDAPNDRTLVEWAEGLGHDHPRIDPAGEDEVYVFRQRASLFGHNAADWRLLPPSVKQIYDPDGVYVQPVTVLHADGSGEFRSASEAERREAEREAARRAAETGGAATHPALSEWPHFRLDPGREKEVDLDTTFPKLLPGSWMVLSHPGYQELYGVVRVRDASRVDYGLTAKVARVKVDTIENLSLFGLRETVAFLVSERLALAEEDVTDPVQGDQVELAGRAADLPPGRKVVVRGRRARVELAGRRVAMATGAGRRVAVPEHTQLTLTARPTLSEDGRTLTLPVLDDHDRAGTVTIGVDSVRFLPSRDDDPEVAEVATLLRVHDDDPRHTVLEWEEPLDNVFDRATAGVLANAAFATHGETVAERLGSGDATREYQRFALRQAPLTYTAEETGLATSLEVRVGDVKWNEVPTLYGEGPRDRAYTTRRQDDGTTVVQFGDGHSGARLPTGRENVQAVYRKGIGRVGNVRAGQLSLLMTRALGLRSVKNPLAAGGGQDPQELESARTNAPVTVLTLDRIVSLRDFEDYARTYPGIAKAQAVWTWDAGHRGILLTVAGPEGDAVSTDDGMLGDKLRLAAGAHGDVFVPVRIHSFRAVRFHLKARVTCEPDRLPAKVGEAVAAALGAAFSFGARRFGQRVNLSEVVATIQAVPGVRAVDVDALYREGDDAVPNPFLRAEAPRPGADADAAQPAELLTLSLAPDDLTVVLA
jgi:predicted phage baseplate assembly protein